MADTIPTRDIALSLAAKRDIAALLSVIDQLKTILEISKTLRPALTLRPLIEEISKKTKIKFTTIQRLFVALENLQEIKNEIGDSNLTFASIHASLDDKVVAKKWGDNKNAIISALDSYNPDDAFSITVKAQKLSYLYERLLHDAEIITDARPVYNSKGDDILEFVITHTLVLTSASLEGETERLHLAMDAVDVLKLQKACERAIIKAKILRAQLAQNKKWNVGILRDNG